MLEARNIRFNAGNNKILKNCSAVFEKGKSYMILGPNGSGKSSFLRVLTGLQSPTEGKVLLNNVDITSIPKQVLAKQRAVLSQLPELHFPLSVEEVVMMGRYPHFQYQPSKTDTAIRDHFIQLLQLNTLRHRNYLTLSGGEKQRVQFARVLAQLGNVAENNVTCLFLDEPLTSLDIGYQQEFLRITNEWLRGGINRILITVIHDLNLALQHADQVLLFSQGEIIANGSPGSIIQPPLIEKVFGVKSHLLKDNESSRTIVFFS